MNKQISKIIYLSLICLLPGLLSSAALALEKNGGKSLILAPESPIPILPPIATDRDVEADLQRKKERRMKSEINKNLDPIGPSERKYLSLVKEGLNPKPLRLHMTTSLVYPFIKTSGNQRENYTVEPTAFYHLYYRLTGENNSGDSATWLGFRLAPLCGAGVYKGSAGRYCFTHFGPMIGIGKVNPATASIGRDMSSVASSGRETFQRSGYYWMSGVALQHRSAKTAKGAPKPDQDLNTKGLALDSPGLWTEVTYSSFYYHSIGVDYLLGIQLGKGKIFAYLGVGMGLWH